MLRLIWEAVWPMLMLWLLIRLELLARAVRRLRAEVKETLARERALLRLED